MTLGADLGLDQPLTGAHCRLRWQVGWSSSFWLLVLHVKSLTHLILDLFTFTRSYQMPQQAHIYTIGTEGTVLHISQQSSRNQPDHRFFPVTGFSFQLRTMTLDVAAPASLAQVGQNSQQEL